MVEAIAPPKRVRVIRTVPAESYGPLDVVVVATGELLAENLLLLTAQQFCRRWNTEHPAQWAAFQPTKSRKRWLDPKKEAPAPSEDDIWTCAAAIRSERRC